MSDVGAAAPVCLTDLRQLYYFAKLAEHGSFSAAAMALNMTQPSLSASLGKLESTLGLQLVDRSVRGIELTESGRVILDRAKAMLRQNQAILDLARTLHRVEHQQVNIGLSPSIGAILAVPLAETFHLEAPGVNIHVTEGMAKSMVEQLRHNHLDIACGYRPVDPKMFVSHPLITEELFLVTAPDNWAEPIDEHGFAVRPISLKELSTLPLALPNNSYGGRKLILDRLAGQGLVPNIAMSIDGLQPLLQVAERASAYTILPQSSFVTHLRQGKLAAVRIENNSLNRTCYLIAKREMQHSALLARTIAIIFKLTAELIRRNQFNVELHKFKSM